ncbi:tRNA(Met) cytidine acetyltransferase TmcA [Vibrio penaeicida]|uniref:tRNA(Met) cytidine acetyltransferase TmcA n=1 Tax=Vibrio penaeicida TaxID=104609 RepID=UPI000CEA6CAD|nr:GNAT family N-acetyltransferase [Vibrio penaeicida]
MTHTDYITQLFDIADHNNHRYLVDVSGDEEWVESTLNPAIQYTSSTWHENVYKLGGKPLLGAITKPFKFGTKLLGSEMRALIYDCSDGFDANSFTAACGTVVGGGIVFLINLHKLESNLGTRWLRAHLASAIKIGPSVEIPALPEKLPKASSFQYTDQLKAVDAVQKVLTGKRKRPLVMTADRGRGKSSAIGIAAAKIMLTRKVEILVTAPSTSAVAPMFEHAQRQLDLESRTTKHIVEEANGSCLRFIAPDELLSTLPDCDLLIVDEASAVPIPLLIRMTEQYHRMVFSTTVHGYEGCGRGFTLKFTRWLQQHRAGWRAISLDQPIRWAKGDPLESWLFDAFLLDADLDKNSTPSEMDVKYLTLSRQNKNALLEDITLLKRCFGLLVNAHYQTTPNDLFQILNDNNVELWLAAAGDNLIGVVTIIREGNLSSEVISGIVNGKRRPKGHLVPASIANHLGIDESAQQKSARVMRIAVHPEFQRQGVGAKMLSELHARLDDIQYLSTSFGATDELLRFWQENHYQVVRIGNSRDQASGCHSVIMVRPITQLSWFQSAIQYWQSNFVSQLPKELKALEPELVSQLFLQWQPETQVLSEHQFRMLSRYAHGGNGEESISHILSEWLVSILPQSHKVSLYPLVALFLQNQPCSKVSSQYGFSGRKALGAYLREQVLIALNDLQCKS